MSYPMMPFSLTRLIAADRDAVSTVDLSPGDHVTAAGCDGDIAQTRISTTGAAPIDVDMDRAISEVMVQGVS